MKEKIIKLPKNMKVLQVQIEGNVVRIAYESLKPVAQYQPFNPPLHYHGTQPCWNNPCYWCGA